LKKRKGKQNKNDEREKTHIKERMITPIGPLAPWK
jgi:hypothetical protein